MYRKSRLERPIVGDWVLLDGDSVVREILPRRSKLSRRVAGERDEEQPLASNIDEVWVIMALDGDFNLARLDRYLSLVAVSGAEVLLLLSKADLVTDAEEKVTQVTARHPRLKTLPISIPGKLGLDELKAHLARGRTIALLGSSGVGKSTLVNTLAGSERMRTGITRKLDGKGRHTTSHRQLHLLAGSGLIIDSPGMRELGLWEAEQGVRQSFEDLEDLALNCRFRDCRHDTEPGCAIRSAVAEGRVERERRDSWLKLKKEAQ